MKSRFTDDPGEVSPKNLVFASKNIDSLKIPMAGYIWRRYVLLDWISKNSPGEAESILLRGRKSNDAYDFTNSILPGSRVHNERGYSLQNSGQSLPIGDI